MTAEVTEPGMVAVGTRCRYPDSESLHGECGRPAWGMHPSDKKAYCYRHYVEVDARQSAVAAADGLTLERLEAADGSPS